MRSFSKWLLARFRNVVFRFIIAVPFLLVNIAGFAINLHIAEKILGYPWYYGFISFVLIEFSFVSARLVEIGTDVEEIK